MDNATVLHNDSMVPHILDLFKSISNTSNLNNSTSSNVLKNSNKVVPLVFICGTAFVILICCIAAKNKRRKKQDNNSDFDDSCNWDSMDDCGRGSRTRDEKMLEHKATCHDHRSHYEYQPQLHSGHYDLHQKNISRSNHEYEKVNEYHNRSL